MAKTIFGEQIRYFLLTFVFVLFISAFSLIVLYGGHSDEFATLIDAFFNLGALGLTGEVTLNMDSLVFITDPRGFVSKFMVFVFMTFASLIMANLFIGILSEAWILQLQKHLWEDHLDSILRDNLRRHLADDEYADDLITKSIEKLGNSMLYKSSKADSNDSNTDGNVCTCNLNGDKWIGFDKMDWICFCFRCRLRKQSSVYGNGKKGVLRSS